MYLKLLLALINGDWTDSDALKAGLDAGWVNRDTGTLTGSGKLVRNTVLNTGGQMVATQYKAARMLK